MPNTRTIQNFRFEQSCKNAVMPYCLLLVHFKPDLGSLIEPMVNNVPLTSRETFIFMAMRRDNACSESSPSMHTHDNALGMKDAKNIPRPLDFAKDPQGRKRRRRRDSSASQTRLVGIYVFFACDERKTRERDEIFMFLHNRSF